MITIPQRVAINRWASLACCAANGLWCEYRDIYPMYYAWCRTTDNVAIRNRRIWIREFRRLVPCHYDRGRFYDIAVVEINKETV